MCLGNATLRILLVVLLALSLSQASIVLAGNNVWTSFGLANRIIVALAIDPKTPTTIYAATRDGVFKRTSDDTDWYAINSGLFLTPDAGVTALAIDPLTPTTSMQEPTAMGYSRAQMAVPTGGQSVVGYSMLAR